MAQDSQPSKQEERRTSSIPPSKYRGATVEDLDPPPALSSKPSDPVGLAMLQAYERDYSHLTVISQDTRSLLGYLSIPRLQELLKNGTVTEGDPVEKAMIRFRRSKGNVYKVITMDTPLEELEEFFDGSANGSKQDFAIVTDWSRRFVLGVATKWDLDEFVRRRPSAESNF